MLGNLRSIVQEVGTSENLNEVLEIIVRRVKEAMAVDVCSVYLSDGADEGYVLMATNGLNPSSVGKVRLNPNEGLVGLVGERQEAVNLENAADHPRYRFVPGIGEEGYHAFLGVPIIHLRNVVGVLVVQQIARRLFSDAEADFLFTVAAQLAGSISHAAATGGVVQLLTVPGGGTGFIQGIRGADGVAVGRVVVADPLARLESIPDRQIESTPREEEAFRSAVAKVQKELRANRDRMASVLPREARAIFDVYVMLLGSSRLISSTLKRVRAGNWAPGALRETIAEQVRVFERMDDPYLGARAEDIREIGRRILLRLQPDAAEEREYPDQTVLLGDEVGISHIAEVPVGKLAAIVSRGGSALSHTAVLARALGVPAVMGLADLPVGHLDGRDIVVDGYQGRVYIQPTNPVFREFHRLIREERELSAGLQELQDLPAETPDGFRVPLYVNMGLVSDLNSSTDSGAEGVGLYRTEFPFMVREFFPGEDEQFKVYCEVLRSYAGRPVTMRTLDVGGDKSLPYFPTNDSNPFLGWRGIRVTLDHPEIFITQLRAMLRANAQHGNLLLLLPMVSRIEEVDEAKALLQRAHQELLEADQASKLPQIGVMI